MVDSKFGEMQDELGTCFGPEVKSVLKKPKNRQQKGEASQKDTGTI